MIYINPTSHRKLLSSPRMIVLRTQSCHAHALFTGKIEQATMGTNKLQYKNMIVRVVQQDTDTEFVKMHLAHPPSLPPAPYSPSLNAPLTRPYKPRRHEKTVYEYSKY